MTRVEPLIVRQPYDGVVIDELEYTPWSEVDTMLDRATAAFRDRDRWLPAYRRIEILRHLADLLGGQRDASALLIAREGG